ncbi:MAG: Sapep family Mn(2+)-dependent dipeptidase [Bacilli bacterium]
MDYKKLVEGYNEIATKTLQGLIKIDSVYDQKSVSVEKPYGEGVAKAFEYMKKLATNDGFSVDMCDGHCIEISTGSGEKTIGIFAHLDEVPISGDWKYPPFGGEIHDDVMYGRGTSDDKGPAIAAYYALKALKDNNLINGFKVKLVLGGDEERGSSCLAYYFHTLHKPDVTYGFTPDGDFPLIYGEKGIRDYTYKGHVKLGPVISIKAGVAPNAVIDSAIVRTKNGKELKEYLENKKNIKYKIVKEEDNDIITVEFIGVSAHGSTPELGINAGLIMCNALGDCFNIPLLLDFAKKYKDLNGRNLNACYETKYLGLTTYNVGMISYKNEMFNFVVNFRYPENVNSDDVISQIQANSNLPIFPDEIPAPVVYFDPDKTEFIKVLAKVYVDETGDTKNKPMTIGGGTYAKEAKNTVAFGSHFPGKEDRIHGADEKIDMEDFLGSMPLYAHAIYALGNIK